MNYLIEPCASSKAYEIKFGRAIRLEAIISKLDERDIFSSTPVVLLAKISGKAVSIYASGRAMIKEVTREEAEKIAKQLSSLVEKG